MIKALYLAVSLVLISPLLVSAETVDFGGHDDEFKGAGDKTPPQCQINFPKASTTSFYIRWNCEDDVAAPDTIQSELWITRQGEDIAARKIESFLGFPAAAFIDEKQLGTTTFTEGLPATFRLIARDTAGNAAVSNVITIRAQDTSISDCTVKVATEKTEAVGGTSGIPSLKVTLSDVPVTVTSSSNIQTVTISSSEQTTADPCEIDSICTKSDELNFTARVTSQSNGTASGTLAIAGGVSAELTGTSTFENAEVTALELSGETQIEGTGATVTLSCSR